jgi:hypothetical protein
MAVEATIKADPKGFAQRVALEYDQAGMTFIRWNGGGDLFPESIDALHHLAIARPDIIIWVVTRIPEMAVLVQHLPNVYVHFSLDKDSLGRAKKAMSLGPRSRNFFFSYQAAPEEQPAREITRLVSVIFFNNYEPTWESEDLTMPEVCPLNGAASIVGMCERCRRCFNGDAVADAKLKRAVHSMSELFSP